MVVLIGEWVNANLAFSAAFLVAVAGVVALAWYVIRADQKTREALRLDEPEPPVEGVAQTTEKAH